MKDGNAAEWEAGDKRTPKRRGRGDGLSRAGVETDGIAHCGGETSNFSKYV